MNVIDSMWNQWSIVWLGLIALIAGVDDLEHVKRLCRSFGADETQAETMARQLLKRAGQIAEQRECSRTEAMAYLLDITLKGARGETPEGFEGGPPPSSPVTD